MYFIGVDPGVNEIGVAVVDRAGVPLKIGMRRTQQSRPIERLRAQAFYALGFWAYAPVEPSEKYLCVEGQASYLGEGASRRPKDLIDLAHSAAYIAGAFHSCPRPDLDGLVMPDPGTWAGTNGKPVRQRQMLELELMWAYKCGKGQKSTPWIPEGGPAWGLLDPNGDLPEKKDWSHILDAIGLARWLAMVWRREDFKARKLAMEYLGA